MATNGEIILTSECHAARAAAEGGIAAVKANAGDDRRYDRRLARNEQPYFVLKSANGQVLGTSEMYSSRAAMEGGVAAVMACAVGARVE